MTAPKAKKALAMEESTDLDSSVRAAVLELQSRDFPNPEVLLLLGTGVDETSAPLSEPTEVSLSDLPEVPRAWRDAQLIAGRSGDVRVWACTDAPEFDATPWARAWPIWLARASGAGSCLITAAGSALAQATPPPPEEGYLLVEDHLFLEGASPLRGLASSSLGPLFPDQGAVHDDSLRRDLLREAARIGLNCAEGVLACVPGPTIETPAERAYFARAGAHATAQDIGSLFHAMAHCGLNGLTLIALLGTTDTQVQELLAASERLAPGLAELIHTAIPILAARARHEREEDL